MSGQIGLCVTTLIESELNTVVDYAVANGIAERIDRIVEEAAWIETRSGTTFEKAFQCTKADDKNA